MTGDTLDSDGSVGFSPFQIGISLPAIVSWDWGWEIANVLPTQKSPTARKYANASQRVCVSFIAIRAAVRGPDFLIGNVDEIIDELKLLIGRRHWKTSIWRSPLPLQLLLNLVDKDLGDGIRPSTERVGIQQVFREIVPASPLIFVASRMLCRTC
jgi:hypothetical protein